MSTGHAQDSAASAGASSPPCVGYARQIGAPPPRSLAASGFPAALSRDASQERATMSCSSSVRTAAPGSAPGSQRFSVGQPNSQGTVVHCRGNTVTLAAVDRWQGAAVSGASTPLHVSSRGASSVVPTMSAKVLPSSEVHQGSLRGNSTSTPLRVSSGRLPTVEASTASFPGAGATVKLGFSNGAWSVSESANSSARVHLSSSRSIGTTTPLRGNSMKVPSAESFQGSMRGSASVTTLPANTKSLSVSDTCPSALRRGGTASVPVLRSSSMTLPTADAWQALSRTSPTPTAKRSHGAGASLLSNGTTPPLRGNSMTVPSAEIVQASVIGASDACKGALRGSATPIRAATMPASDARQGSLRDGSLSTSDGRTASVRDGSLQSGDLSARPQVNCGSYQPQVNCSSRAEDQSKGSPESKTVLLTMPDTSQASSPSRPRGSAEVLRQSSSLSTLSSSSNPPAQISRVIRSASLTCPTKSSRAGSPGPLRVVRRVSPRPGTLSPTQPVRQSSSPSTGRLSPLAVSARFSSPLSPTAALKASPAPPVRQSSAPQWAFIQHTRAASPPKYAPPPIPARSSSPPVRVTVSQPVTVIPQYAFCGGSAAYTPARASSPVPLLVKTPGTATTPLPLLSSTSSLTAGGSSVLQVGKVIQPAAVRAPVGPTPVEAEDTSQPKSTSGKDAEGSDILKAMLTSVEAIERQLTDGMLTGELSSKPPARESSGGAYAHAPWYTGARTGQRAAKKDVAEDTSGSLAKPDLETYVSWLKTVRSETEEETKRFREAFFTTKGISPTKSQDSQLGEAASIARVFANAIFPSDAEKHSSGTYSPTDSMDLGEDFRPYTRIPAIMEEDSTASGDTSGEADHRHHSASSSSAPVRQPRSEVALLSEVSDLKRALQQEVRERENRSDLPPANVFFASDDCSIANSDEHEERKEAELRMRLAAAQLHMQEPYHNSGTRAEQELLRQYDADWRNRFNAHDHYRDVRLSSEEADEEEPRNLDDLTGFSSSWGSSSSGMRRPRDSSRSRRKQRIYAIEAV